MCRLGPTEIHAWAWWGESRFGEGIRLLIADCPGSAFVDFRSMRFDPKEMGVSQPARTYSFFKVYVFTSGRRFLNRDSKKFSTINRLVKTVEGGGSDCRTLPTADIWSTTPPFPKLARLCVSKEASMHECALPCTCFAWVKAQMTRAEKKAHSLQIA